MLLNNFEISILFYLILIDEFSPKPTKKKYTKKPRKNETNNTDKPSKLKRIRIPIIDEISMVSATLLTLHSKLCADSQYFGGIGVIVIGIRFSLITYFMKISYLNHHQYENYSIRYS